MPENCRITTIEKYENGYQKPFETLRKRGGDRITLSPSDAGEILKKLTGPMFYLYGRGEGTVSYGFPKS